MDLLTASQQLLRRYLEVRGVQSRNALVGGHSLHYYDLLGKGPGPAVLLVHGLGGSANGFFRLFAGLSRRFSRVVSLDLPGHGFSQLPSQGALGLRAQYEVLWEFARTTVREPSLVVGNSLGGAMSLTLAHEQPAFVRALALIGPAGAKVDPARIAELAQAMQVASTAQARALTRRLFHRPPVSALLFASALRKMYGSPAVRAAFEEEDLADGLSPALLSAISMPTLLLWGESDRLLPSESVDYFRAHLPAHAQIHRVEGFGHVPQVERPRQVLRYLLRFADEHQL